MKIFLFALLAAAARVEAAPQPDSLTLEDLPNVYLGMLTDDLLKARPNVLRIGMSGAPLDLKAPGLFLTERLKPGGTFSSASFTIQEGKLTSMLLVAHPKRGEERAYRRKFVADCIARWGKGFKKHVPKDEIRPGEAIPTLTWERGDVEYVLMLPKERKENDTKASPVVLQARSLAAGRKTPWKESKMTAADEKKFFEEHDVLE
jgi:hypothetical protein